VFEPFHSAGERRGAGLGLAIARGFAEANGATVWAEDTKHGAHLVLELPVSA
jgi:two-component system sensor histidine kinase KdpD